MKFKIYFKYAPQSDYPYQAWSKGTKILDELGHSKISFEDAKNSLLEKLKIIADKERNKKNITPPPSEEVEL